MDHIILLKTGISKVEVKLLQQIARQSSKVTYILKETLAARVRRSPLSPTEILRTSFCTLISLMGFNSFFSDACTMHSAGNKWRKKNRKKRKEQKTKRTWVQFSPSDACALFYYCSSGGESRRRSGGKEMELKRTLTLEWGLICNNESNPGCWPGKLTKKFPLPGLEPGSLGWEPSILTS
jgi:hypothetical protein